MQSLTEILRGMPFPRAAILVAIYDETLQEYIMEKTSWTATTFNKVDWEIFGAALKKLYPTR